MACSASEERLMLAELEGLGGVSLCGCGTVHLSVGSVTVRLAPEAFLQAVKMCQQAAQQLTVETMMRTMGVSSSVMH
ncbi:hypothetical protein [Terriglobus tenax]|uniref:hypothetical protein n=1 Tax=Terriglobus tenax TaxID=1111115 RepID=UPI0021E02222|nr:hypothetical protein [Terriglobus tenax]